MRWLAGLLVVTALLFVGVAVLKQRGAEGADAGSASVSVEERARLERFWSSYRRATDFRIAGQTAEAASAYAEALQFEPGHQDALYYLGNMDFVLGDLAGAERAWRRLVELDPSNARGHAQLGVLYSCVGQPGRLDLERAAAEFQRALEINREQTGPLLQIAEVDLLRGDLEAARRHLDAVVGSNYSSVPAHVYLAYIAWKAGDARRATALLAEAERHTRDAAPAGAVPGEGDTRTGRSPLVSASGACRPMRVTQTGLADVPNVAGAADSLFLTIDSLLRDAREILPR